MPSEEKKQQLQALKEKVEAATAVYLSDYRGLSVPEVQELKLQLQKSGAACQLAVVKNTLLTLAFKQSNYPGVEELKIEGPTAILLCFDDEISPLSVLSQYAQKHNLPTLKGGYLNREWLPGEKVRRLASLPPLATLQNQLTYTLAYPLVRLQRVLNWPISGLVQVLGQIQKSKD